MSENNRRNQHGAAASNSQQHRRNTQKPSKRKSAGPVQSGKKNDARQKPRKNDGGRKYERKNKPQMQPLKIIPLGGLEEIGKNITVYEYGNDIVIVDCGMAFPDEEMPGIDIVIPDFSYLIKNADKVRGLVLTHGHEDHIGGIPYLLKNLNVPIYGTRLTLGLTEGKLREHGLMGKANLNVVKPHDVVKFGSISVEFIHVNHSIPDSVGMAITTPVGTVIQTGDFKIDTTPIDGEVIDISRFAEIGRKGVLALLSDSTNAERQGFTASEKTVGNSFSTLFRKAGNNRIIVATFSSNIHRIQQIVDEAVRCGRKVAVSGRSMINVVTVASEMGYLKVPDGVLIDIDDIKNYTYDKLVIITTGSQGEPLSALHRMAYNAHRNVEIVNGDMIIISANPIPGNEKLVDKVVNELLKRGAEVVYEKMYDVHVSGHACQEELKLMLSIVKPEFFIPVHGEEKHLIKHAGLGQAAGIENKNILIANIGDVIEIKHNSIKVVDKVTAGSVMVDGLGVGDVGSVVLRDRKHLADDGIIIVAMAMEEASGEVVSGPEMISRGFVYVKESEELIDDAREAACKAVENCYLSGITDRNAIKGKVKDAVSKYIYEKTRRSPMVLPIILSI